MQTPCFFLGANSPKGFYSKFDQLFEASPKGKCFLLKGGPGTGKSTVLKKIAAKLSENNLSAELIYCSADTNSLDAVMTADGKICALDATLPHGVEPKYPGAYEKSINLCDCWNEETILEYADEITKLFDKNRSLLAQARRYVIPASSLIEEAMRVEMRKIDAEKVVKTAKNLCRKEIGRIFGAQGAERVRFLSAISDKGVFVFNKTAKILANRIYIIEDETGASSKIFMNTVRKIALEHGLDTVVCKCPVFPNEKIDHIFIPKLKIGFMTDNKFHKLDVTPYRTIHSKRFLKEKSSTVEKIRIKFALREAHRLIKEASQCMKEAKQVHDELENMYIPAMDFEKVENMINPILKNIP